MRSKAGVHKGIGMELAEQGVQQHLLARGVGRVVAVHVNTNLVWNGIHDVVWLAKRIALCRWQKGLEIADAVGMHRVLRQLPLHKTRKNLLWGAQVVLGGETHQRWYAWSHHSIAGNYAAT